MGVKMNEYGMYIMYFSQTCKKIYHGRLVGKCHKKAVIFKS